MTDAVHYRNMSTRELRGSFLLEDLFVDGALKLVYTEADRAIVGGAVPTTRPLALTGSKELAADHFCKRRELGVFNIGGRGRAVIDGQAFTLEKYDCLYVGRGARTIELASEDASAPTRFYLLSYPAHAPHPTTLARRTDANVLRLGSDVDANKRTIRQYVHEAGVKSCQLVMGYTELAPGNVWNTMPPHTHERRTEVYLYFDLPDDQVVIHMLGRPEETRHILVRDGQAVISPSWSLHSGCGTSNYSFVWGMGGENQTFADMDDVNVGQLQ